ncbi:hypothetical protein TWF718_009875 [Orbilia javanica]|uniref:Uncharacterized protein n=1 Tax=Orbilia javanica TaxID=47235 RepID=A0AAN8RG52_9PEZI
MKQGDSNLKYFKTRSSFQREAAIQRALRIAEEMKRDAEELKRVIEELRKLISSL